MANLSARKLRYLNNLQQGMEPSKALAIYEAEKAGAKGGFLAGATSLISSKITGAKDTPGAAAVIGPGPGLSQNTVILIAAAIFGLFLLKGMKGK